MYLGMTVVDILWTCATGDLMGTKERSSWTDNSMIKIVWIDIGVFFSKSI